MTDDDLSNEVQREIEDRAQAEVYEAHPTFADWCGDYLMPKDMAAVVAYARLRNNNGQSGAVARERLQALLDRIVEDYQTWRVVQSRRDGEWEQVADDVRERDYDEAA
jgi:hypothetical protein